MANHACTRWEKTRYDAELSTIYRNAERQKSRAIILEIQAWNASSGAERLKED